MQMYAWKIIPLERLKEYYRVLFFMDSHVSQALLPPITQTYKRSQSEWWKNCDKNRRKGKCQKIQAGLLSEDFLVHVTPHDK